MTGDTQAPGHRLAGWASRYRSRRCPWPRSSHASGPAVYVSGQVAVRDDQLVTSGRLGAGAIAGLGS